MPVSRNWINQRSFLFQTYNPEVNSWFEDLEGEELDVIIIRDSFHHFTKKIEMIESIKKTIKKDGILFILEFAQL